MIKIISYNLNGIRAALKKNLINWIEDVNPDILCFQEIKAMEDQIPTEVFEKLGYIIIGILQRKKDIVE